MEILAEYGVQTTFYFPLVDAGANDFEATPVTHAAGDTQISKDGGAFANTTNSFSHEGNGIYSLTLTATEMQAAKIVVTVIDSATKAWEDQAIIIATYGNASGQHAFNLNTPNPAVIKNQAKSDISFKLVSSTDHVTAVTGATVTAQRSLDNAAFAAASGTVTEIGNGLYGFDAAAADMNGNSVILRFTATGADAREIAFYPVG